MQNLDSLRQKCRAKAKIVQSKKISNQVHNNHSATYDVQHKKDRQQKELSNKAKTDALKNQQGEAEEDMNQK